VSYDEVVSHAVKVVCASQADLLFRALFFVLA